MKRKRMVRKLLSMVLALIVCVTSAGQQVGFAASKRSVKKSGAVTYLQASRIPKEKLPEGDWLYFGTSSAEVQERGVYAIRIYREGNIQQKATVTLRTNDMTAVYGKDYEILDSDVENLKVESSGKSLMEEYAKGKEVIDVDRITEMDKASMAETEKSTAAPTKADKKASMSGKMKKSSLAEKKEKQTGKKTRATYDKADEETKTFLDSMMEELGQEAMKSIIASSTSTVTFEAGENVKTVRFRILEDRESEGTEGFSLVLDDPSFGSIYEVGSASIVIDDDEKKVNSKVSFSKKSFRAKDKVAKLTVKRERAEYSICDMTVITSGDTAVPGTDYEEKKETLAFAPYETEKTIEIKTPGSGTFSVLLTNMKACEAGGCVKATVDAGRKNEIQSLRKLDSSVLRAADDDKKDVLSFDIALDNKNYTVEYKKGDASGTIYDMSYEPPIEAGIYYFSLDSQHNGHFTYGDTGGAKPWGCGNRKTEYVYDERKNTADNYGKLEYYHTTTTKTGYAGAWSDLCMQNIYYQYYTPDWKSRSSFGGGQGARIIRDSGEGVLAKGHFDRKQGNAVSVVKPKDGGSSKIGVRAVDETKWLTPKSYVDFYGVIAMYRKMFLRVENPTPLKYRSGDEKSTSLTSPANIKVRCGAQPRAVEAGANARVVYANVSPDNTNYVFSIDAMSLNGHSGIYGAITGYSVILNPDSSEKKVTKEYPKDFVSYLNKNKSSFGADKANAEIKKINSNLSIIPYDEYFLSWISSLTDNTKADGSGWAYDLKFVPNMAYYDVDVEVLPAVAGEETVSGAAHFTDETLKSEGKHTFHAGDELSLKGKVSDENKYNFTGYEVSVNGGDWNTIRDTDRLFLDYDKSYRIRPCVSAKSNCIEIRYKDDEVKERFAVQNLISASALKGTDMEGKYIIQTNPKGKTAQEKAAPLTGERYDIRVAVKNAEDSDGNVYRPTITFKNTNETFQSQYVQMKPSRETAYNVVEIGMSKVPKTAQKKYTVRGVLSTYRAPVRQTGTEKKYLPAENYVVSLANGQQTKNKSGQIQIDTTTSNIGATGEFVLENITGVEGDTVMAVVANGLTGSQTFAIKLSGTEKDDNGNLIVDVGQQVMSDSSLWPEVVSVDYTYKKAENVQKQGGNTSNSVHIYDDTFTVTAKIDPKGRKIKKAIFTVYHYGSSDSGTEYTVTEEEDNKNTFVCTFLKMPESFNNGDGIKIRLVDEEGFTLNVPDTDENGQPILDDEGNKVKGESFDMVYPDRDTGLVFYIENELKSPQSFDVNKAKPVNVPLMGSAIGSAQSGLLLFGQTWWDNEKTGYTIQIGIDCLGSTIGTKSTPEKLAAYRDIHDKAKEAAKGVENAEGVYQKKKGNAERIFHDKQKKNNDPNALKNLASEKKSMLETIEKQKKDSKSAAKKPVGQLGYSSWSAEVAFAVAFDYVYNPVKKEYIFSGGSVVIGGTATYNKTMYTVIYSVPAFLNFTATLQLDFIISYSTEDAKQALTAKEFDSYAGNLADRIENPHSYCMIMAKGKVQVGVGMCGVLSAKGYVALKLQFDIPMDSKHFGGSLMNVSGGVSFDVLVGSIDINIVSGTYGTGTLKDKSEFSFFGGLLPVTKNDKKTVKAANREEGTVLKTSEKGETLSVREYTSKTPDFGEFGKENVNAVLTPVSLTKILDDAAEHTRPHMIPLDENGDKKMLIFTEGGARSESVLYYTIYDGVKWSTPLPLADEDIFQSTPVMERTDDKVVIAWAEAGRKFTEADSTLDKLSLMGISVLTYDMKTGKFGEKKHITPEDGFCDQSPQISIDGTKVYLSYMKRDLTQADDESDLLDFDKLYSTMATASYDYKTGTVGEEKYVSIEHDSIDDPLVMDYHSLVTEVDGDTYIVSTYTIDEDKNLETSEDKEMYLGIYNADKDREYYPIRITDNDMTEAAPRLTDLNGRVYLTWLENGHTFRMANVSHMLSALFDKSEVSFDVTKDDVTGGNNAGTMGSVQVNKDKYINGFMTDTEKNKNWYKIQPKEIITLSEEMTAGLSEKEKEKLYAEVADFGIYADLANGKIPSASTNFSKSEEQQTSIGTYKLVTDGDDIYVFFTDAAEEEDFTGQELYGACYMLAESDEALSGEEEREGFSKAVQLTHNNKVIDELDLYMTKNQEVSAVSNYYSQWIDDEGKIQYGKNELVEIDFETMGSLKVDENAIELPTSLTAGENDRISYDVTNEGMITSKGFDYTVSQIKGTDETIIKSGHEDVEIRPGESHTFSVPWTIPENLSDMSIQIEITETGVENAISSKAKRSVPCRSDVVLQKAEICRDNEKPYVSVDLKNRGNLPSKQYDGVLVCKGSDGEEKRTAARFKVRGLASGEECAMEIPFAPEVDDFDGLGTASLELKVMDGEEEVDTISMKFTSSVPVCAEIENGETVTVKANESLKVRAVAAPWNDMVKEDVRYSSENPAIAAVDTEGKVTGKSAGETQITAYYPNIGVSASVRVKVEKGSETPAPTKIPETTPAVTPTTSASPTSAPDTKPTGIVRAGKAKVKIVGKTATYMKPANKKMKKVVIPNTVTVAGKKYKVTKIANGAFKNNKYVTSITIGKYITHIGKDAFRNAKKCKTIRITSTRLKSVGKNVCKNTHPKLSIYAPSGKRKKYKKLFKTKIRKL